MLLLALTLAPVLIDPAHCTQQSAGPYRWQTDGQGGLSASTDARFKGEVVLRCRMKLSSSASAVTVEFDKLLVAFTPAAREGEHSGLTIGAEGQTLDFTQISREDWIEASNRSWRIDLGSRRKDFELTVRLVDDSAKGSVRIDLRRLRMIGNN